MTVAVSILLAAVVGGVMFVLIDGWQRQEAPLTPDAPPAPRPAARTVSFAAEPRAPAPPPERRTPDPPSPLWSGWAERDG